MTKGRSEDGGETWQAPLRVSPPGPPTGGWQDTLLPTSSGRIVLPVEMALGQSSGLHDRTPPFTGKLLKNQWVPTSARFFNPAFGVIYVLYSDDEGRTWHRNRDGELILLHDWNTSYGSLWEPSVAEVAPGRLLMVMRTGLGRLFQAWSNDNGETWTRPQPTALASTEAPAQIRRLPTGHLLMV